jgi:predicted aspartyl protease
VCGAPKVFIGDEPGDRNPVVSVEVNYDSARHEWLIFHHHYNGLVAARNAQYAIEDWSNANQTKWGGSLNRNRYLYMVGELRRDGNNVFYVESLYNKQQNNRLDMQMATKCEPRYAAVQPQPVPTVPVQPAPQSAPIIIQPPAPVIIQNGQVSGQQSQAAPVQPSPQMADAQARAPAPSYWPQQKATVRDVVPIYPGNGGATVRIDVLVGGNPVRMLLDTGATTMLIPMDLANKIVREGQGRWEEGRQQFKMADGSVRETNTLIIREVRIGRHVVRDVQAGVTTENNLILPFPTVNQIGPFMIDTRNGELVFGASS